MQLQPPLAGGEQHLKERKECQLLIFLLVFFSLILNITAYSPPLTGCTEYIVQYTEGIVFADIGDVAVWYQVLAVCGNIRGLSAPRRVLGRAHTVT